MTRDEQVVRITARMYQSRDTMRFIWGTDYPARVEEYRRIVRAAMAKYHCEAVVAPLRIMQTAASDGVHIDGLLLAALLAAAVEEIEAPAPQVESDRAAGSHPAEGGADGKT